MEEESTHPIRLMSFVSEEQLDESKRTRGPRVEDGTFQRDRTLFEILKENKDKKDAEFNERFKHRPPKALDDDETEFLESLEMSRKEYERQMADDEEEQIRSFQAAIAAQSTIVQELKETPPVPIVQEQKAVRRKNPAARPLSMIIKVQPQAKKAKVDAGGARDMAKSSDIDTKKSSDLVNPSVSETNEPHNVAKFGLVSYSDDSEDDD